MLGYCLVSPASSGYQAFLFSYQTCNTRFDLIRYLVRRRNLLAKELLDLRDTLVHQLVM